MTPPYCRPHRRPRPSAAVTFNSLQAHDVPRCYCEKAPGICHSSGCVLGEIRSIRAVWWQWHRQRQPRHRQQGGGTIVGCRTLVAVRVGGGRRCVRRR